MKYSMLLINKINQLDDLRVLKEMGINVVESEYELKMEILNLVQLFIGDEFLGILRK